MSGGGGSDPLIPPCIYAPANDERTRVWRTPDERHLPKCIYPWHTGPTSGFMVWRAFSYNMQSHLVFLQGKVNSAHYIAQVLIPCYCQFFNRKVMCFSVAQHTSTYGCCDAICSSWCSTTALASKNHRSLTNWTHMGHDEAGTYSFSRAFHNHCQIATTGARCLGQSIEWWHSAPLWLFACENTRLCYRPMGVHCVLIWLFGHPLLWHVCFIWSEFIITYYYNDKLPVTSIFNTTTLSLKMYFSGCVYTWFG